MFLCRFYKRYSVFWMTLYTLISRSVFLKHRFLGEIFASEIQTIRIQVKSDHKKFSLKGPVVAQRVVRGIALLFHDRGTSSSTSQPYFTPGKDPVPIVHETEWTPGPVWTGGKSRPTGIRSPNRPALSQSLYRLSYPAHKV